MAPQSNILQKITKRIGTSEPELRKEIQRRATLLTEMAKKDISKFDVFNGVINNYYKDKEGVLKQFGIK
jgi:hypothetical protein